MSFKQMYWKLRKPKSYGREIYFKNKYFFDEIERYAHFIFILLHSILTGSFYLFFGALSKIKKKRLLSICLIEHFGDIVACEPIARKLKEEFPDSLLVWFVRDQFASLVETNPNIDYVIKIKCLTEWILLKRIINKDKIFELHFGERVCPKCGIRLKKENGCPINVYNYYEYGNILAAACMSCGIIPFDDVPVVYIPNYVKHKIDDLQLPRKFIVIHCCSNEKERDWDLSKWRLLVEKVYFCLGIQFVEIGLESKIVAAGDSVINLCGQFTLLETAEIIRRCEVFVGIDSGPSHLANALAKYSIILLGSYRKFEKYMPFSGNFKNQINSKIIFSQKFVKDIPLNVVERELMRVL